MKAPASFRWLFFLVAALFSLFHPQYIIAGDSIFVDDFNSSPVDSLHWQVYPNLYGVVDIVNNESVRLSSSSGLKFPYMFVKNVQFPEHNYSIKTRFKFSGALSYGNGLVFSDINLPNNTYTALSANDYIFAVWTTSPTSAVLLTTLCTTEQTNCTNGVPIALLSIPSTSWNDLIISEVENHYTITIGDKTFETKDSSRKISKFWIGNPQTTVTTQSWASIFVDNINISKMEVPEGKVPVIIIPGFGGSWDLEAILAGAPGTHWEIPSFIKNYDGILQSLKNAGFVEDENLFVFPYDWRKPLSSLADDLQTFIDSNNLAGKVDLIGHSMGGLVARSYAQKYGTDKVDKILTAGSPHLGLIDTYGLWEGAKIWDGVWWQNVLLEIATEVNRRPDETKVAAIRRVSPSVLDLFPTFPFLVSGGSTLGIDTMIQQNQNLKAMNLNAGTLGDKLTPYWSDDIAATRKTINVIPRTNDEALEEKWVDGSPIDGDPFGRTPGDGTVTKESAAGPFGAGEKLSGWHSDLLSTQNNIGKIFEKLGLDTTFAVSAVTDNRINSFAAILRSPGTLEVCNLLLTLCNDQLGGLYFPEFKLFILPGYSREDLVVRVKETGETGTYKLHLGNIDDSPDWVAEEGNLSTPGQIDFYGVKNDGESISVISDKTPPSVAISAPENKFYKTSNVPVLAYSISDNWDFSPAVETNGWSDTEGEHTITVTATDKAGNVGTSTVTYWVDNTAPAITIVSPQARTYEDDDLPALKYSVIDNQDINPSVVSNGWSKTEGIHTVEVRATDKAGNVGIGSVTYTVQNHPRDKNECKKNNWRLFRFLNFKNQGSCESYYEKHKKQTWNWFWDLWRRFDR